MTEPSNPKPDRTEMVARFGCGAIAGLVLVFGLGFVGGQGWGGLIAVCLAGVLICGLLAMRFGDRFWKVLSSLLR